MEKQRMNVYGFLHKAGLYALLPLLPFITAYIWLDPYKVLRHHDDYFGDGRGVNKGVVSLDAFRFGYGIQKYDSFIVGASISCYYPVDDWVRYLPAGAKPFHFDSSGQTTGTTRRFLEFLDAECDTIANVLLVTSPQVLKIEYDERSLPGVIPPGIYGGGLDYLCRFHYLFFRKLSSYRYYSALLPWLIDGTRNEVPGEHIFEPQPIVYNRMTNEEAIPQWDCEIEQDSASFYMEHPIILPEYGRPYIVLPDMITPEMKADFIAIAEIAHRRGCTLHVIVSPTLSLELLSENDDSFLRSVFGSGYCNLTGEFREELADRRNFYDNTHYRPALARKYMQRAYSSRH